MSINIRDALYQKGDDFRGAIFLTYSLNLNFFEQLIMPKLSMGGCSHVLVLSDAFGYNEALQQGGRTLAGVGTRYVCSPLANPGQGVQHAKLILLAGPRQGRLLLGSGNLTVPGYGRNLELFNRYDLRVAGDTPSPDETAYPFAGAWQLLRLLQENAGLSAAAQNQLDAVQELAPWLGATRDRSSEMALWHSFDQSIYGRLRALGPVRELQIIAPFWHLDAIQALVQHFRPRRLVVGVDAVVPNLDGAALAARCAAWGCALELRAISANEGHRGLHAKAIIGIGDAGAWCVTGSANCTPPALLHAWRNGGNLELVSWQSSPDPGAFEPMWQDKLIAVTVRDPFDIVASDEPASAEPHGQSAVPARLVELSYADQVLVGRVELSDLAAKPSAWGLELLRRRQSASFQPDDAGRFSLRLDQPLDGPEAGRALMTLGDGELFASPYRWIDQPTELARYGRRSYYARVRESLSTFDGAGKLFEELMNYLWERVDPQAIHDQGEHQPELGRRRRRSRSEDEGDPGGEVPPAESFITEEELVNTLAGWADDTLPFDRSTMSLRDLLSLALLRLATETAPPATDIGDESERNEDADAARVAELERKQRTALEQLRAYLENYCARYSRRLTDPAFVARTGPRLLFENHFTLGRVLLEVYDKVDLFTRQDLRRSVFQMVTGMFWPQGIGLSGDGVWPELAKAGYTPDELRELWDRYDLTPLLMTLFLEGWSNPVPWDVGLYDPKATQLYLRTKILFQHMEQTLGKHFWEDWRLRQANQRDVWGFRTIAAVDDPDHAIYPLAPAGERCTRLASYLTPVLEKYRSLWRLWPHVKAGRANSPQAARLVQHVRDQGFSQELNLILSLPKHGRVLPLPDGTSDCPGCFTRLPQRVTYFVREGQLALCPNCRRTVFFWEPRLSFELDPL